VVCVLKPASAGDMTTEETDLLEKMRANPKQTLAKEAEEKIFRNARSQEKIRQKIEQYNLAVSGINSCLSEMRVYEHQLPAIGDYELSVPTTVVVEPDNGKTDAIEIQSPLTPTA